MYEMKNEQNNWMISKQKLWEEFILNIVLKKA